jgi:hypothetical protein
MLKDDARGSWRDRWSWLALALVSIFAGIWLRLWQLRAQTLIDDEWHAVRKLVASDFVGIATHFGYADYCIPLTLYYRALYAFGALDEWQMHLPLAIAGIVLVIVVPWLARPRVALPMRATWTALLALSPVLVYLSRTARPYAIACLAAYVAIIAFDRWRDGSRFAAFAYVFATVVAAWFHLLTVVFTLWPFVWFGVPTLVRAIRARRFRDVVPYIALGVVTIACLALVLAAPLANDWHSMAAKAGTDSVTLDTIYRALLMMFGTAHATVGVVVALLLALGVRQAWRRERDFTAYVASMIIVGAIVVALARPAWIQHQQTFVRYVLPALPFVLWFVAEGIVAIASSVRLPGAAPAIASVVVVALAIAGPMRRYYHDPNQFMGHARYQFDFADDENPYITKLVLGEVPSFYRDLATRPSGSITLIETPAMLISNFLPEPWYQDIHRQNVKFALAAPVCGDEADEIPYTASGTRFRRLGRLSDIVGGATWGADYLVLRMRKWSIPPDEPLPWPDMHACAANVEARLGAPIYRDADITVFALAGAK